MKRSNIIGIALTVLLLGSFAFGLGIGLAVYATIGFTLSITYTLGLWRIRDAKEKMETPKKMAED